jgi:thiol-disulfide isomerase/thioredoxin
MVRFRSLSIAALLMAGLVVTGPAVAEPEDLPQSKIRQEMMQPGGPLDEFLQGLGETINKGMEEALAAGRISKDNPEGIRAELGKVMGGILPKAAEFRKTLKEPEHRLKLDLEMLQVAAQAGKPEAALAIIDNWKGEAREMMIVSAAQAMQQVGAEIPASFDPLLKEAETSKDEQVKAFAKRLLEPFFRKPVGMAFPDFPAGKTTIDGQPLTLARFKDKVVLVDFWATWCPPCRAEVPHLVAAYDKFKDKGFEIIGISFDQDRSAFDTYLTEQKMTWPQYFDGKGWENEIGPTYGIQSIPGMYLLGKDGKVVATDLRGNKLEQEIEKLLK